MSKLVYINSIKQYFKEKNVITKQINSIISDYELLYDEALESGYSHDEIIKKLGTPESIYRSLLADLTHEENPRDKFVALSPFISVIIFFVLGFGFSLWHPGWLVFLSVPLSAILLSRDKEKYYVSSIFFTIIAYFIISYIYPAFYAYGTVIFVIPASLLLISDDKSWKSFSTVGVLFLCALAHQLYGHLTGNWDYTWLIYAVVIIYAIIVGKIKFGFEKNKNDIFMGVFTLVLITGYLLFSLLVDGVWGWSWLVLLLIPVVAIYRSEKFKHPVAYMPFISLWIFFGLGFGFGLWQISWIVFLLIPMVAILTEKK
ncbi:HAAS signaling domain-containing protein [Acholeplasma hippikon]|uniref:DUF1700 domain-containing protein n=1 Tax=Acholeplasma hippikon TaxID=264636 RepID=A0A449BK53_9MOLU|nr:hypothetical protein [Acholeplasma hippikon]VEU82846.1 Uncharacterised protein [Acholeplasma hippikon]